METIGDNGEKWRQLEIMVKNGDNGEKWRQLEIMVKNGDNGEKWRQLEIMVKNDLYIIIYIILLCIYISNNVLYNNNLPNL
jgi:hypothetical protein